MSERVKEIHHKGKRIVYCDLSNAKGDEIRETTNLVDKTIIDKGTRDQLFLVNIKDCLIDRDALTTLKESSIRIRPYLKASASFGLTGLKSMILNIINKFTNLGMTAHPDMEKAKDYLAAQYDK